MNEKQNNKKKQRIILLVIAIILLVCGSAAFAYHLYNDYTAKHGQDEISSIVASTTNENVDVSSAENPIDFESLKEKNSDIYAWIKVPGTKVDYPVVQSSKSDEMYLKHSAIDKSWVASGAIYTEMVNTKTFKDRVTLIYGHNGYSDTMFTTLHKFEKKDFFDKHKHFYIYTPKAKLTYRVVSAFKYDDRHIMNSFQFQNDNVFLEFLDMIQNPSSNNKNVWEKGWELTKDDKIVVLSTCITNQRSSRYLVCGVLEKNEQTN